MSSEQNNHLTSLLFIQWYDFFGSFCNILCIFPTVAMFHPLVPLVAGMLTGPKFGIEMICRCHLKVCIIRWIRGNEHLYRTHLNSIPSFQLNFNTWLGTRNLCLFNMPYPFDLFKPIENQQGCYYCHCEAQKELFASCSI